MPDLPALHKWCDEAGISGSDEELASHERVLSMMREHLDRFSGEFKQFEKIKQFKLITEEFTVENGLLTPKMSVKRRKVLEKHDADLQSLY